ncbi:DUF2577 family protein [Bacillus sp. RG28]|uniref:DUF2577 family protein n=1 Tax=Gottfriedia endophytica TaxID=2820819 RepID=A0A940NHK3_9BACI|nr:DUF2577 family protein [Gottfriedia endophytica]MBP0725529.1 DUF2577 family protein [Gottfriedia endophytica]
MPYDRIIQIVRQEGEKMNTPLPMIGIVSNENPLSVDVKGMTIEDDQLFKVYSFLPNEQISLSNPTTTNNIANLVKPFAKGQTVILFPTIDKGKFVVMKVVE